MGRDYSKLLPLAVFLSAFLIQLMRFPPWNTLTYDGALYIDIARNLAVNPTSFTYQGIYMMYRPPLYPYTLSIGYHFIHGPLAQLTMARIVSLIFFALTAVITYLTTTELFGRRWKGLIASAFFITNPLAFTMGTRELVHSEFTFFYALSLYLIYTGRKRKTALRVYLAFVAAGLAVLTRYTGLSIIAVIITYLYLTDYWNWVKRREYWIGFALFGLTLLPWLYLGYLHYGGALRPFQIATRVVTLAKPVSASEYVRWLMKDVGKILLGLALFGFLRLKQNEEGWFTISWATIGFMMILTVTHKETRFITFLSPVIGILAEQGAEIITDALERIPTFSFGNGVRNHRKAATIGVVAILLVPVFLGAVNLKNRWNMTGRDESEVLRYASEHYVLPNGTLLVSPYLYTMAGLYYPDAHIDMILYEKKIEKRISEGYYDLIIHEEPNTYLNITSSYHYILIKEFYKGKFKLFLNRNIAHPSGGS